MGEICKKRLLECETGKLFISTGELVVIFEWKGFRVLLHRIDH